MFKLLRDSTTDSVMNPSVFERGVHALLVVRAIRRHLTGNTQTYFKFLLYQRNGTSLSENSIFPKLLIQFQVFTYLEKGYKVKPAKICVFKSGMNGMVPLHSRTLPTFLHLLDIAMVLGLWSEKAYLCHFTVFRLMFRLINKR